MRLSHGRLSGASAVVVALAAAAAAGTSVLPARATGVGPASQLCQVRTAPPPAGLSVISWSNTGGDPRLRDYTLASAALGEEGGTGKPAPVHVEVLLPPGYGASSTTRYPVLYLLHGHGGHYSDWAGHGVERIVGPAKMIVVMPDGGYDGWYSDWYGTDVDGHTGAVPPGWETFHIDELIPWVDASFATIPTRAARAIAGLSMGGFGSMSYAARHPDLFSVAGAFSGADDPDLAYPAGSEGQTVAANLPDRQLPDHCVWGDPLTQDVVWRTHDPTELAANLTGVSLSVWFGNGEPGDTSPGAPAWSPAAGFTEFGIGQENQGFVAALTATGQHPFVDAYGPGTHDWFYWERDLGAFVGRLPAGFWSGSGPATLPSFGYASAEPSFSVWGWTFRASRDVQEFTYLTGVNRVGFSVRGSGRLTVSPPGAYPAHTTVAVTDDATGQTVPATVSRDPRSGTITFTVDLGPSHEAQQYLFGPTGETATFPTAYQVRISSR